MTRTRERSLNVANPEMIPGHPRVAIDGQAYGPPAALES